MNDLLIRHINQMKSNHISGIDVAGIPVPGYQGYQLPGTQVLPLFINRYTVVATIL